MGAGAAVIFLVVGAVLLVFIVGGVIMLVAAATVGVSGRNPRPLAWGGVALLAVPVVFVVGAMVFAQLTEDPDTVELDLREPVRLSSLPDDNEAYPGMLDYHSDRVDLVLADGSRFRAEVDGVLVWSKDGYVTRVTFDRRAVAAGEAEEVAADWRTALGAGSVEVDPEYSDHGRVRGEVVVGR